VLRFSSVVSIILLLAITAWADQRQMGTVSSTGPFQLRGANVTPGQGVPEWPLIAGDKINAGAAPVTVNFPDGSIITVNSGSEIIVTLSGTTPVVKLICGSANYALKSLTAVKLVAGEPVTPNNSTGLLSVSGCKVTAGWWTTGHTVLVVAGAGAIAGLGYGIVDATSGGASVSPTK
jgi:hypothetical protein